MESSKKSERSVREEIHKTIQESKKCSCHHSHAVSGGGIYGLGVIGAAFYFFQHMSAREDIWMTIAKVFFWPAFLVYQLLEKNIF